MAKRKYRERLDPVWAKALLTVPSKRSADKTVAEVLSSLRDVYAEVLTEARLVLKAHPFHDVIAEAAAKRASRKGPHHLIVGEDGILYLETGKVEEVKTPVVAPPTAIDWSGRMPHIKVLRDRARELGIDPIPFGQAKTKLRDAILKAEEEQSEASKPKMTKTAPAVGPTVLVNPSETTELAAAILAAEELDLDNLPG